MIRKNGAYRVKLHNEGRIRICANAHALWLPFIKMAYTVTKSNDNSLPSPALLDATHGKGAFNGREAQAQKLIAPEPCINGGGWSIERKIPCNLSISQTKRGILTVLRSFFRGQE